MIDGTSAPTAEVHAVSFVAACIMILNESPKYALRYPMCLQNMLFDIQFWITQPSLYIERVATTDGTVARLDYIYIFFRGGGRLRLKCPRGLR